MSSVKNLCFSPMSAKNYGQVESTDRYKKNSIPLLLYSDFIFSDLKSSTKSFSFLFLVFYTKHFLKIHSYLGTTKERCKISKTETATFFS